MENLIEIIKEAANCKGYHLFARDSNFGIKVYISDNMREVYGVHVQLHLNELLSIDNEVREIGYSLLKVVSSENFLILTFIKL